MAKCTRGYYCPVEATIDLIGGKYKAVILWHLTGGTKRFSELKRLMPKITEKMLTQQLRDLESNGLITRTVYPVVPPKVEYDMSELGRSISPVLQAMCDWGSEYIEKTDLKNTSNDREQL